MYHTGTNDLNNLSTNDLQSVSLGTNDTCHMGTTDPDKLRLYLCSLLYWVYRVQFNWKGLRERDRQTDRLRDRHRKRQTDRERQRGEGDRDTHVQINTYTHTQITKQQRPPTPLHADLELLNVSDLCVTSLADKVIPSRVTGQSHLGQAVLRSSHQQLQQKWYIPT